MRKLMAVLVMTSACAMMGTKSEAKKSEAVTEQDKAAQHFQAAADAQKKASDEQSRAEAADAKVAAAQKALADARADARGQHMKAKQAHEAAQQMAQQSSEQGMQSQTQAAQLQEKGIQQSDKQIQERAKTWMSQESIEGQVLEAKGDSLKVRTSDKKDLSLGLSGSTSVSIDGQQGEAAQIKAGDDVRASYQMVDGKARALQLEVTHAGTEMQQDSKAQDSSSTPAQDSTSKPASDDSSSSTTPAPR